MLSDSTTVGKVSENPLDSILAIERTTRRGLILDRLRDAVSGGQLAPGTHLAEIELSERLGVSRGTLREALRALQQEGLLVADARNRLTVRVVDAREVHEIFEVRAALEALACREICEMEDPSEVLAALSAQIDRMARPDAGFAEKVKDDLAFHEILCRLSGNGTLYRLWLNVGGLARLTITAAGPETAVVNMAVERHSPLLEFLERRDADGASAYLRTHMAEAETRIRASLVTTT